MAENSAIAPVAPAPLLLDAREAARLCGVSMRTWWALHSAGKTPLPVRLGRRTLWRFDELAAWIVAGCPARDRWEQIKQALPMGKGLVARSEAEVRGLVQGHWRRGPGGTR